MNKEPTLYLQNDPLWGNKDYSAKGEHTTISRAGCGVTCAAMVIASLVDLSITPADTAEWSLKNGFKALRQGTYYSYFVPQFKKYGINCKQVNFSNIYGKASAAAHKKIIDALSSGKWVIACMGKGVWTSQGHYILAWKTDGKRVYIKDPASQKAMRMCNDLQLWLSQIKYAWIVETEGFENLGDDEVIEKLRMAILGKDTKIDGIFKEGSNYVNLRQFCELLGLEITSKGKEPIVSMSTVKMRIDGKNKVLSGMNAGGTTYVGARAFAESMDKSVGWDSEENRVIIE